MTEIGVTTFAAVCVVCGRHDADRPMVYRGEPVCCGDCAKVRDERAYRMGRRPPRRVQGREKRASQPPIPPPNPLLQVTSDDAPAVPLG